MCQNLVLFPSSGGGETPILLGPLQRANLNNCSSKEADPISETLCFPVFRIPDDGQSPKMQNCCGIYMIKYKEKPQRMVIKNERSRFG
jgi:hypothetical protein